MQAEVERCKTIVTDILHSAGNARVEEMETTRVSTLLDAIVSDWQPTHATVPLGYSCEPVGATVIAGASLRQAIWNLLDNAAEASPHGIALTATRNAEEALIAVSDDGPGFTDTQLASVGKPHQSSKGAGHGLGLFLASNVARRLGGRLEVANRPRGGAIATLVVPLARDRLGGR